MVTMTIAKPTSPTRPCEMTRPRKMAWKIGVKSQASVLPISEPATAVQRLGWRVGAGV